MSGIYVLAILIFAVYHIECAFGNKLLDKRWKMNTKLSRSFPCLEPQRRAVPIHELITDDDSDIYYIFGKNSTMHVVPDSVVLYRCENAGCCPGKLKTCSVQKEEPVTFTFKYYYLTNNNANSEYSSLPVSNHTVCGCAEIKTNNIK